MGGVQGAAGIFGKPMKSGFEKCKTLHLEAGIGIEGADSGSVDLGPGLLSGTKDMRFRDMAGVGFGGWVGGGVGFNASLATPSFRVLLSGPPYSRYGNGLISENTPSIYPAR